MSDTPDSGIAASGINGSFVPNRRSSVASVELDGSAVLFDEISVSLHELNPVATVMWSCFDGTGTIDEIAIDLAEAFRADVDGVRAAVLGLAHELGRKGLLEGVAADEDTADDRGND